MSPPRAFVHVVLEGFRQVCRGRNVEDLVALNERLDRILARHAPGFRKPSIDEATFAGEPPWGRFMAPLDWGASLQDSIASGLHLDCSVGIAANAVAARLAARLARPRGILFWMSGREKELMDGMPLEELDELRPEQLARLRSEGIATLDALAGLGPSQARALLGVDGERLVELVRGDHSRMDPTTGTSAGGLRAAFTVLANRLSRRLEKAGLRARGLELNIDYADGVARERHTQLHRPTSASEELAEAALRLYPFPPRSEPVVRLSLNATGLSSAEQFDLFASTGPREVRVTLGQGDIPELRIDSVRGDPLCSAHTGGKCP